jgi:tRNA (guanine-N7-)-methyltransferase
MRKKPNLIPRMSRVASIAVAPDSAPIGRWLETYGGRELHVELGCGKGRFTCGTAQLNPDVLTVGIERVPGALVIAMERAYDADLTNIRFMSCDVAAIGDVFAQGEVSRIYINFCDPWPGKRRSKRRLTHENFLRLYRGILRPGGQIHFKTDNAELFDFSLTEFDMCGFTLSEVTRDLHGDTPGHVMTDYEAKFVEQNIAINRCVATPGVATRPALPSPRRT